MNPIIVILAGGLGKRMKSELPKILHLVGNLLTDEWIDVGYKHLQFLKDNVDDADITKFSSLEFKKLQRTMDWIKESRLTDPQLSLNRGDFYRFVIEHDKRRGTDFLKAFPEMDGFLDLCKGCANEDT